MQNNSKRICERYGYPPEIETLLEELCVLVQENVPGLRSILLSGSIATGDLVYRRSDKGLKIFSDLDLLAFADSPRGVGSLGTSLRNLEERFHTNLFHVDLSVNSARVLRRIPPSYQMAELRQVESLLLGEDCRAYFPLRADARFSKQALIGNLWKAILYWPDEDAQRQECFQWVLARLILDLPLLVFSELQNVIPGHFARAQAFCRLSATEHPLAQSQIQSAVMQAAAARRAANVKGVDLWPRFLETLDAVLQYLKVGALKDACAIEARESSIEALLAPRSLRRLGGELRAAMHQQRGWMQRCAWWMRRKEAWAGVASIEMIAYLANPAQPERLFRVAAGLSRFCGDDFQFSSDADSVTQFRREYWDGLAQLYPYMCQNAEFVRRAGNW